MARSMTRADEDEILRFAQDVSGRHQDVSGRYQQDVSGRHQQDVSGRHQEEGKNMGILGDTHVLEALSSA